MQQPKKPHGNADRREHFPDQQWSDFARGLLGEAEHRQMKSHLALGCAACRAIADRFGSVARLAANDQSLVIPQALVQCAISLFEPAPSTGWLETLEVLVGQLIPSPGRDWQLACVRSGEGMAGQSTVDRLLFRAGDYSVDLQLDPPSAGEAGEIVGQIANDQDRSESLEGILVQMVAVGRTIGETSTNRFGEFLMDFPSQKKATLRFALRHSGKRVDLPLNLVSANRG